MLILAPNQEIRNGSFLFSSTATHSGFALHKSWPGFSTPLFSIQRATLRSQALTTDWRPRLPQLCMQAWLLSLFAFHDTRTIIPHWGSFKLNPSFILQTSGPAISVLSLLPLRRFLIFWFALHPQPCIKGWGPLQRAMAFQQFHLHQLLSFEELGDRRPTWLLQQMTHLLENYISTTDEVLLW